MNPGPQVAYLSDDDADVANGLPGERRQCGGKLDDVPCQSPRSGNALVADFPVHYTLTLMSEIMHSFLCLLPHDEIQIKYKYKIYL
jgi:hypothetical protein